MITTSLMSSITLALALIVTMIVVFGFVAKKTQLLKNYQFKDLEIIGGTNVSKKTKIVLVKVLDQKILLGVSDNAVNTLHVFNDDFNSQFIAKVNEHESHENHESNN